jgi:site-specific recombinase XerD|nr:integrase [Aerococcus mictus]
MPQDPSTLVAELKTSLTQQRFNRVAIHNYCRNAEYFLQHLSERGITLDAVTPDDVSNYLRLAVRRFRKRHGHPPAPRWEAIPRSGIHALLRHSLKRWPPEPEAADAGERLCREVLAHYEAWLREERGLASASIYALMWEAKHFFGWYAKRSTTVGFADLSVPDIDAYMDMRAPGLTRKSLKDVAERIRGLLKYLYRTGLTPTNLTPHVITPLLYAYEGIPSALNPEQIAAVLEAADKDRSSMGLRDYAILQLLATYGLRSGEISRLRLEDVDWRGDVLHIRHSKTGARSVLPLLAHVGEALIAYLRHGRPETDVREIFVRTRAPYVPMVRIYNEVRRRIEAAGIELSGKRGPHIFRHARAVSLLRAEVPRKVIGDVLGHRSTESTIPYLKLATEDLRAIALEIPGAEVGA